MNDVTIFDKGGPGQIGHSLPALDVPEASVTDIIPRHLLRRELARLPEVSENEVVRHFLALSVKNYHVDRGFYPLGSCTMKYNPKINEDMASLPGFSGLHPLQDADSAQGALQIMYELGAQLCEITGMNDISLQPAAGAHGELTGLMMIRKFHAQQGRQRQHVLIPDSAHGTNPASVSISGYKAVQVPSNEHGRIDITALKELANEDTAGIMVTNPSTLGLFEREIEEVCRIVRDVGGVMYMDGANLNALLGIVRPGDIGFDIVHINLHKTFSTPHGGGGPGAGPLAVSRRVADFLPVPRIVRHGDRFELDYECPDSIGKTSTFYGNFGVLVRAYTYILALGADNLPRISENAIINANYLLALLENHCSPPFTETPMHEFVLSGEFLRENGVRTVDLAKRLLDYGFHAPTVYFPLIVKDSIMIEPTETESRHTLEAFAEAFIQIIKEAQKDPELLKGAPETTPVTRLDEVRAVKELDICHSG